MQALRTLYSRIAENEFWKEHCSLLPAMLGWFFFSACLTTYNKEVFGKNLMNFPCPLLITSVHFFVQFLFSYIVSERSSLLHERNTNTNSSTGTNTHNDNGAQIRNMPWGYYLCISIPCGIVTASDIGISNLSLARISITFYTMVKASSPIFVVISAYLFGLERITYSLILVVLTISAGEILTVLGEVQFDAVGFFLCSTASILSGIRWTLVQMKIRSIDPPITSTIATLRLLSPVMFISMVFFSIVIERPWEKLDGYFDSFFHVVQLGVLALFGATLAIAMVICEFYLILKSSAIVLMIGGVCKELTTIFVGVSVFGDEINIINLFGCFIVFFGVFIYKLSLYINKMEKQYELAVCEADNDELNGNHHGVENSTGFGQLLLREENTTV